MKIKPSDEKAFSPRRISKRYDGPLYRLRTQYGEVDIFGPSKAPNVSDVSLLYDQSGNGNHAKNAPVTFKEGPGVR